MAQGKMSPQMQAEIARGPPYPSMMATSGGVPTVAIDVPVCAVLLFLYMCSAAINMFIFQRNRIRGKLFIPSVLLFGFSMARILTCILRIVWATMPTATSTALAAQIFVNAGILIVYIINILFAQRILRALQPKIGWNPVLRTIFKLLYSLIGCCLVLIITFIVYGSYTLSVSFHHAQLWVLRGVSLYLVIFTAIPLVIVPLAFLLPRSHNAETFGEGSMASKAIVLMTATCLCVMIAGFRTGIIWSPARPATDPAWYDSRQAFYTFNFMLEILVLIVYIGAMMDKRFHVPNGSSKRKSYAVPVQEESESGTERAESDLEKRDSSVSSPRQ